MGAVVVIVAGSVTAVAAVISLGSIAVAAVALVRTQPGSGGSAAAPGTSARVALSGRSKTALILAAVAAAAALAAPTLSHPTGHPRASLASLALLVIAGGVLAAAGLELIHDVPGGERAGARGHPRPHRRVPAAPSQTTTTPVPEPVAPALGLTDPAAGLHAWSTESLCRGWKLSFLALRASTDAAVLAGVVERRRCYLDELACRDPDGFARWTARDPYPVVGHPERFIRAAPAPPPVTGVQP